MVSVGKLNNQPMLSTTSNDKTMTNDLEENFPNTNNTDHKFKKKYCKIEWLIHGLAFLFICCISAGAGIAIFFGERATEIAIFKTEFEGTIHQLQSTVQAGLAQKFAASRLLNKIYAYADWYGYGTEYGQKAPYFLLPGIQNYTIELMTLSDVRGSEWHPLVDNTTRPAWELWAKQIILKQGFSPTVLRTINNTGNQSDFDRNSFIVLTRSKSPHSVQIWDLYV